VASASGPAGPSDGGAVRTSKAGRAPPSPAVNSPAGEYTVASSERSDGPSCSAARSVARTSPSGSAWPNIASDAWRSRWSYDEADALAAERIRLLSASGLKLDAVRVLLPCMQEGGPGFQPCEEVRQALRRELGKLDEKLQELARSRSIVARFLAGVDG